ncbi:MAG: hypothetical protein KKB59_19790 [Spirochaetes bacterium]|nr:hypothetical protein [Spirochaetota bacterium]
MIVILSILLALSFAVIYILAYIIRGAIQESESPPTSKLRVLTGIETEELRRRAILIGKNAITTEEILNLIKTINLMKIGLYRDNDAYVPADIYDEFKK